MSVKFPAMFLRTPTRWSTAFDRYRWWTINLSRHHVKLGPVAACWFATWDGGWTFDVCLLARWTLTMESRPS